MRRGGRGGLPGWITSTGLRSKAASARQARTKKIRWGRSVGLCSGRGGPRDVRRHVWRVFAVRGGPGWVRRGTARIPRCGSGHSRAATCRRFEFLSVRLEFELRARVKRLAEIFGVFDCGDHEQPVIAVWMLREAMNVFRDRRVLAVRDTVLSEVAFTKIRRDNSQRSTFQN